MVDRGCGLCVLPPPWLGLGLELTMGGREYERGQGGPRVRAKTPHLRPSYVEPKRGVNAHA